MSKVVLGARARLILASIKNGRLLTRVNPKVTVASAWCLEISALMQALTCTRYQLRKTSVMGIFLRSKESGIPIADLTRAIWLPWAQCSIF
jgi:hypothetical protein